MKPRFLPAAALLAAFAAPTIAHAQFEQFKGKIKPGLYENKVQADMGQMPGMPPGMGKQNHTAQHCVTEKDIEKGAMGRADHDRAKNCEVKDFKMSGNTASYTMVCKGSGDGKGPPMDMTADNHITFRDGGYDMDLKMSMNRGGQPMNMTQHIESRYIGACTK
jgi:hypothetical protein